MFKGHHSDIFSNDGHQRARKSLKPRDQDNLDRNKRVNTVLLCHCVTCDKFHFLKIIGLHGKTHICVPQQTTAIEMQSKIYLHTLN